MKANCLTRALDQWADNPAWFWLWYNSNHVIAIERYYSGSDLVDYATPPLTYLPLSDFGYDLLVKSFALTPEYQKILEEYLFDEELGKVM